MCENVVTLLTEVDFHVERIGVDSEFCSYTLNKSKLFILNAILPELVGKLFSKPSLEMSVTNDNANTSDMTATGCAPSINMLLMEASMRNVVNEDTLNDSADAQQTICSCQMVYNQEKDDVIGCDNENCPLKWFDFKCVNIRRVPKCKWICPTCLILSEK